MNNCDDEKLKKDFLSKLILFLTLLNAHVMYEIVGRRSVRRGRHETMLTQTKRSGTQPLATHGANVVARDHHAPRSRRQQLCARVCVCGVEQTRDNAACFALGLALPQRVLKELLQLDHTCRVGQERHSAGWIDTVGVLIAQLQRQRRVLFAVGRRAQTHTQ